VTFSRLCSHGLRLLVAMLVPLVSSAQATSFAPLILRLPGSSRALALGDAGIAGHDDDVIFYGPAQIATARGTSASVERFSASANGGALSSVTRIGSGGVGVGFSTIDFRGPADLYPASRDLSVDRGPVAATSTLAVVAVAQTFKKFSLGAAAKYAEDHVASQAQARPMLDLGVARDVTVFDAPVTTAIAVQNIGRNLDVIGQRRPYLPLRATGGVSAGGPAGPLDLGVAAQVAVFPRGGFVAPAGGLELGYSWLDGYGIAARVGARRPQIGESTLTAGAGVRLDRVTFDYALETLAASGVAHRLGIRLR
jgi:hypothetical protein